MDNSPHIFFNVLEEVIAASSQYKGGGVFNVNQFLEDSIWMDSKEGVISFSLPTYWWKWKMVHMTAGMSSYVSSIIWWRMVG